MQRRFQRRRRSYENTMRVSLVHITLRPHSDISNSHIFHPDCLQPWLKTNGSCPVCRFSLVPEDAQNRSASGQPSPQATATTSAADPAGDTAGQAQGQPIFTNILNRLWGQSGAQTSPVTETTPPVVSGSGPAQMSGSNPTSTALDDPDRIHRPATSPLSPGQHFQPPPFPPPSTHSSSADAEADDPAVPTLSSGIPDDYRERHRQRERDQEQQRRTQQERQREEERQYPSYFS